MLKVFLFIFLVIKINHGFGDVRALFVGDQHGKGLSIDKVYPSPGNASLRFAFCCDQGKYIVVYDGIKHRAKVFEPDPGNMMDVSYGQLNFVTFCWDREKKNDFVVVYTAGEKKRVFYGQVENFGKLPETLTKPDEISDEAVSFNFCGGKLSYINLGKKNIYELTRGTAPRLLFKGPGKNRTIEYYKMSPAPGVPSYFVLRDPRANDSGIYKGKKYQKVEDEPGRDELYPHISTNGALLGYIERDPKEGSAVVCLKSPSQTFKSGKSFALEQNALLREYSRMYFIDNTLFCYIAVKDVLASKGPTGLIAISPQTGEQKALTFTKIFFSRNDRCLNLFYNEMCAYEYFFLKKENKKVERIRPLIHEVVPYKWNKQLYFLLLTSIKPLPAVWAEKGEKSWDGFIDTVILTHSLED